MDAGVEFMAYDQPFASRLALHIPAAVAEDEARRISERERIGQGTAAAMFTTLAETMGISARVVRHLAAAREADAAVELQVNGNRAMGCAGAVKRP